MNDQNQLNHPLTPAETGKVFNVTGRTILNLEARGIISPVIRVGKIVRFDLAQVTAQLAAATGETVRKMRASRPANAARAAALPNKPESHA